MILHKKYQIPIGLKYGSIKVPDIINSSNKIKITSFLKGVFDSDGNIYLHRGRKCVQLRQKSYSFLKQLQSLFNILGIEFRDPYYDKANGYWVLWSSKKELVNNFINKIVSFQL